MGVRSDYVSKMKTQLQRWDAEADALARRGEKLRDEARELFDEQIKELRASRAAAQKAYQEMRAAGESAGAGMQATMESAWKSMQKALRKLAPG